MAPLLANVGQSKEKVLFKNGLLAVNLHEFGSEILLASKDYGK